jgi:tripartite-type tricarboxylate transporter receptor subunit TctC
VVVENRPGAAGNLGSETALNSPADGYTLLMCGVANAISATLYDKLNYNFVRGVAPVAAAVCKAHHPTAIAFFDGDAAGSKAEVNRLKRAAQHVEQV